MDTRRKQKTELFVIRVSFVSIRGIVLMKRMIACGASLRLHYHSSQRLAWKLGPELTQLKKKIYRSGISNSVTA